MKKNKAMRLASALLVATLATTCAISGTFAKYTTKTSGSDSARVAKWGFTDTTSQITLDDLFKTSYDQNVQGKADVIAPGTTNKADFKFAYNTTNNGAEAPEVAYNFTVSTDGSTIADSIKNNPDIQWKLDDGEWGTWDNMITAIQKLSGAETGATKQYAAGELPDAFKTNQPHTVAWQWKFEGTGDQDKTDTEMGNATSLAEVKLAITVTATQVD